MSRQHVRDLILQRDYDCAWDVLLRDLEQSPRPPTWQLAIALLHQRASLAGLERRVAVVRDGLAALLAHVAGDFESRLLLADVLAIHGLRQEATEKYQELLHSRPDRLDVLHRLGLCELARASTSPPRMGNAVAEHWRSGVALLLAALYDEVYARRWVNQRLQVYGLSITLDDLDRGRAIALDRIRRLALCQADEADSRGGREAAQALRQLCNDLQGECAAIDLFVQGVRAVDVPADPQVPFPFGMTWYRQSDKKVQAVKKLAEIVAGVASAPYFMSGDEPDPTAPTVSAALRQWYSRLAPVRQAIRWGQYERASDALKSICPSEQGCAVLPKGRRTLSQLSPRICDPACGAFATCNPGYAGGDDPAADMEVDAHRLAIHIQLALAEQCITASTPNFIAAAQHWVSGNHLAAAIGESASYERLITGQIFSLLHVWRRDSERSASLVRAALSAVPNKTLRGQFVDGLIRRGLERCDQRRWEEGSADLRSALTLNEHSEVARRNLPIAIQQLASQQMEAGNFTAAGVTMGELAELLRQFGEEQRLDEQHTLLLKWTSEHHELCKLMAERAEVVRFTDLSFEPMRE